MNAAPLPALVAALAVAIALLGCLDAAVRAAFPTLPRLGANFSSAFLELEIDRAARAPARTRTVVLGDSVLWGYRLRPEETAPAVLARRGLPSTNLAFAGGSPANTYALVRLLLARGVRPRLVVFDVNQKTFNPADGAYARLHPALAPLARPLLGARDAALLGLGGDDGGLEARIDRGVSAVWRLYALRTDLRELLFGDVDAAHALHDLLAEASGAAARERAAHVPAQEDFEGTYDLAPLRADNVSVHFLAATLAALRAAHVPALAILTPTNHALLHAYVDTPAYARNVAYVRTLLERGGARVIDLDGAFAADGFFDNDHLTARASRRFAAALLPAIARAER